MTNKLFVGGLDYSVTDSKHGIQLAGRTIAVKEARPQEDKRNQRNDNRRNNRW